MGTIFSDCGENRRKLGIQSVFNGIKPNRLLPGNLTEIEKIHLWNGVTTNEEISQEL